MAGEKVSQIKKAIETARKIAEALRDTAYEVRLEQDTNGKHYLKVYSLEKLIKEKEISEEEFEKLCEEFSDYTIADEISGALEYIFEELISKKLIDDYLIEYDYYEKDIGNTVYSCADIYVTIYANEETIEKLSKEFEDVIVDDNYIKIFIANVVESEYTTSYLLINNEQKVATSQAFYKTSFSI